MKSWGAASLCGNLVRNCSQRQGASKVGRLLAPGSRAMGACDICLWAGPSKARAPGLALRAAHLCRHQERRNCPPLPGMQDRGSYLKG